MTKRNDNQEVSRKAFLRDAQERYAHLIYNEQYNAKHHRKEVEFFDAVLADDDAADWECQSEEDRRAREVTATRLLALVDRSGADVGDRGGGSRPVVGGVPIIPNQLTGGASCNGSPPPTSSPNGVTPVIPRAGGYDGGLTIGWEGTWNIPYFNHLTASLERAKEQAQNIPEESSKINLYGFEAIVDPTGGKVGKNTWHYKFHAFGITFLIHRNPKNTQQVRATYGAEALMQNPLPALHAHVRKFLSVIGLTVTKETLSRVDMQVMVDAPLLDFIVPILSKQSIKKARKAAIYLRSDVPETYCIGSRDDVQICIYDKHREMRHMELGKRMLVVEHCIGYEWENSNRPITRVEFRIGREALKCFKINSVEDLLKREQGVIDVLTHDWFRLLERPKVRGKENKIAMHPLWERVRALFFEHFTGSEIRDVEYRKPTPVACDPVAYEKQAIGCLKKASGIRLGMKTPEADAIEYWAHWGRDMGMTIFRGGFEHAKNMGIMKGISYGGLDNEMIERSKAIERFDAPPELHLR